MKCDKCNLPCTIDEYLGGERHYVCLVHGTVWIAGQNEEAPEVFVRPSPRKTGRDIMPQKYKRPEL